MARVTGRDPGARPHPRETIREACQRWGEAEVVRRCVNILDGATLGDDELDLLGYLAAARSRRAPRGGAWPAWYPVWALRCLLYVWRPEAAAAVVAATSGDRWRVREMAAKVCLARELGEAADALARLLADPVPRVRVAAARAVAAVGEAEHAEGLRRMLADPDPRCRTAAQTALRRLSIRLDRDLEDPR